MKHRLIAFALLFLCTNLGFNARADEAAASSDSGGSSSFHFAPEIATIFPTFLGAGFAITYREHFELSIMSGITPKPYYNTIASVASELADNQSYKGVINAAFEDNSLLRGALQYNFRSAREGWVIGLATSILKSSGEAGIDAVLAATTGNDYTNLKNLLIAAGKDPAVDLDSTLIIAEISAGYKWAVGKNLSVGTNFGVAKVMSASMDVKTGLPNFEASNAGKSLLSSTEDDLESVVEDYGISPIVGATLAYVF